nr:unnamed protein product [Spirometra erinaceieuropaei]
MHKEVWKSVKEFLSSPCHLNGYEFNLSTTEVFLHSCVDSQLATSTFKRSIKKPEGLPEYLKVIGTGRPEECRRLVSSLFDFTTCKYSSCSFNDVYQPPISGKFYAFAAFRYLTIFLEFQNPGINLTRSQTIKAVDDLCRTDWKKVVATFPEDSLKYIADNCYVGVLMDNLLHGYGFRDDESWKRIEFVEKIAEAPASWALGYALDATGRIPTGSPVSHIDPMAMAVGLTFLLCLLFVLLLILVGIKKHRLVL